MQKAEEKKVLFLGGSNQVAEMVKMAKKMGIYTIVADSAIGAPAKIHADASCDINPSDIKGLIEIKNLENLAGVYAMLGDVTTWNALALCKRLDIPFYLPKEQLEHSPIKDKFKDFCRTFNVSIKDEAAGAVLEFPVVLSSHSGKRLEYATI